MNSHRREPSGLSNSAITHSGCFEVLWRPYTSAYPPGAALSPPGLNSNHLDSGIPIVWPAAWMGREKRVSANSAVVERDMDPPHGCRSAAAAGQAAREVTTARARNLFYRTIGRERFARAIL